MKTPDELRTHIIEKATEDETFRGKLLSNPKTAIEDELGITIPEGIAVQVHENSTQTVHLVLPLVTKLSEAELKSTAGGQCCGESCASSCSGGGY